MNLSKTKSNNIFTVVFFVVLLVALCVIAPHALAETMTQQEPFSLLDFMSLFMSPEAAIKWGTLIGSIFYLITQALPWVPTKYLEKLPPKLLGLIQRIGGNYRGAKNAQLSERTNNTSK